MSPVNKAAVESELEHVLTKLFMLRPVSQAPEYLTSAISQLRRTLIEHERNRDTTHIDDAKLPEWLRGHLSVGPYERTLLRKLFAPDVTPEVVVIRGGSGSGKSSTFQYIDHASKAAAADMPWKNRYNFKRFFVLIDLQTTCARIGALAASAEDDTAPMTEAVRELLNSLASILDHVLLEDLREEAFQHLVLDALQFRSPGARLTDLEGTQTHLLRALNGRNPTKISRNELLSIFDTLKPDAQLFVRLLLFAQLARAVAEDQRTLLVVIDNIDPLPVHVQNHFVNILAAAASSVLWNPLRVAVLARLSTAAHRLGAVAAAMYDHECVDPADIVLHRLLWFFLAPDTFMSAHETESEIRGAIISRLFELWRHLIDTRGSARRLLSAMAGTNVRNAFLYASAWCRSPVFTPETHSHHILAVFQEQLRALFGVYLLLELDKSLAHVVRAQFADDELSEFRIALDIRTRAAAVRYRVDKLTSSIVVLLRDLYLVPGDDDSIASASHIRYQACATGRDFLPVQLTGVAASRTLLLQLAFSDAFDHIRQMPVEDAAALPGELVSAFETALHDSFHDATELAEPAKAFIQWLIARARLALTDPITEADVSRRLVLRELDDGRSGALGRDAFEPTTSRFQAASLLIDPKPRDAGRSSNALNVFTLDATHACPAIARILYLLAFNGRARVRELYGDLLLHGFTQDEVYRALRLMAKTDVRLIYAGLSDSNDDIDPWLISDRNVFLSSAGGGYFNVVIVSPAYLQWAFQDVRQIRVSAQSKPSIIGVQSLTDRVGSALLAFEQLIKAENVNLRQTWEPDEAPIRDAQTVRRTLLAEEVECQSVSGDIFYRSYPKFIYALRAHYEILTRSAGRNALGIERVRQQVENWHDTAEHWIDVHTAYFGWEYTPWRRLVDAAEVDVDKVLTDR